MDQALISRRLDIFILVLAALALALVVLCMIRQREVMFKNFEVDDAALDVIEAQAK